MQSSDVKAKQRVLTGVVTSDKMDKTIVVQVMGFTKHKKYKKTIKSYNKFTAHDEKNAAKTGDTVKIIECRPLSKQKRWRLVKVLK